MAFFDRLYEKGVLRPNGAIKGCVPEYEDGVEINSELTKVGCPSGSFGALALALFTLLAVTCFFFDLHSS
jgi:hypothetical protein